VFLALRGAFGTGITEQRNVNPDGTGQKNNGFHGIGPVPSGILAFFDLEAAGRELRNWAALNS